MIACRFVPHSAGRPVQIRAAKISTAHPYFAKIAALKIRVAEDTLVDFSAEKGRSRQIRSGKVAMVESGSGEVRVAGIGSLQQRVMQPRPIKLRTASSLRSDPRHRNAFTETCLDCRSRRDRFLEFLSLSGAPCNSACGLRRGRQPHPMQP